MGAAPAALAGAAVLSQVAYPLTPAGPARDSLTIASVLLLAGSAVAHAAVHRGSRWAATLLAVTAGSGLVVEAVGTATGVPFGHYTYAGTLGPALLGVPLVVPLAWTMLAYPAYLVGLLVGDRSPLAGTLVGAGALAAYDVFLDPQMVDAGHWTWHHVGAALPGVPGVPLSNYAGWLATALVMVALLRRLLPTRPVPADVVPFAVYLWLFGSSVLAHGVFWGRPAVAGWGALAMGPVAVGLGRALRRGRSEGPR